MRDGWERWNADCTTGKREPQVSFNPGQARNTEREGGREGGTRLCRHFKNLATGSLSVVKETLPSMLRLVSCVSAYEMRAR